LNFISEIVWILFQKLFGFYFRNCYNKNVFLDFRNCLEWGIFEQAIHSYSMVMVPFYDQLGEDARKFIMKESKKNSIKKIVMKENWKNSKDKNLL
jgi:long-subunit acyl-CoA synthetase (AMP-forming)